MLYIPICVFCWNSIRFKCIYNAITLCFLSHWNSLWYIVNSLTILSFNLNELTAIFVFILFLSICFWFFFPDFNWWPHRFQWIRLWAVNECFNCELYGTIWLFVSPINKYHSFRIKKVKYWFVFLSRFHSQQFLFKHFNSISIRQTKWKPNEIAQNLLSIVTFLHYTYYIVINA